MASFRKLVFAVKVRIISSLVRFLVTDMLEADNSFARLFPIPMGEVGKMQGNFHPQASFKKSGLTLKFKIILSKCKNSCFLEAGH